MAASAMERKAEELVVHLQESENRGGLIQQEKGTRNLRMIERLFSAISISYLYATLIPSYVAQLYRSEW